MAEAQCHCLSFPPISSFHNLVSEHIGATEWTSRESNDNQSCFLDVLSKLRFDILFNGISILHVLCSFSPVRL